MWMMIIFDVDRDENCCRLCLYLTLIMCIFALQVVPTMHTCFNYWTFDLLFNSLFFRFRESGQKEEAEFGFEGVWGVPQEEGERRG